MSLIGKSFKLSNGNSIPAVGYGTGTKWFKLGRDEIDTSLVQTLKLALSKGFVHIDGAEVYNTDQEIGQALEGQDRKKLFLTDKFFAGNGTYQSRSPHGLPYESLKWHLANQLKTDYVDLYLLHSPFIKKESHGYSLQEAWQSAEKAYEEGLAKNIGVSNFSVDHLKEILEIAKVKPVVNQIEFNPYLQDQTPGVVEFSQKNGILIEAYSPLGPITKGEPGELTKYLDTLASKYKKSPAQVLLRWTIERGVLPVTTSGKEERIIQYVDLFDFELASDEVEEITSLGKKHPVLRQFWEKEYAEYN